MLKSNQEFIFHLAHFNQTLGYTHMVITAEFASGLGLSAVSVQQGIYTLTV